MLRAAAATALHLTEKQRKDINDMLNKIDDPLRHDRNRAMHAPLTFSERRIAEVSEFTLDASVSSASPHAKQLKARQLAGKNLIEEFNRYAALAECLHDYAQAMYGALLNSKNPTWDHYPFHPFAWPEKPKWPHV